MKTKGDVGAISPDNHVLYDGLDRLFARIDMVDSEKARSALFMTIMNLDSAIDRYKAGDHAVAMGYFETFKQQARHAIEVTAVEGVKPTSDQVKSIVRSLISGYEEGNVDQPLPFGTALSELNVAYSVHRDRAAALALKFPKLSTEIPVLVDAIEENKIPKSLVAEAILAPAPVFNLQAKAEDIIPPTERRKMEEADACKPAHQVQWRHKEYKYLAAALEPMLKRYPSHPDRKNALVAMTCLQLINKYENQFVQTGVSKTKDGEEMSPLIKEYRKRLLDYVDVLMDSRALAEKEVRYLRMAMDLTNGKAKKLEQVTKSDKKLSRSFFRAVAGWVKQTFTFGNKKPEQNSYLTIA